MDKTLQYTQVALNFDSVYNLPPQPVPCSTTYIPMYSSTSFAPFSNRPSSPLFHRSISPPPRRPIPTGAGPKFNFDLYKMDENNNEYTGYSSPSYRSLSPSSSSRIIHHYPIHSPLSSPRSKSGSFSKLRQINDELCSTLARSELHDQPSSSLPPHYHIHHYPLSQQSHPKHHSRSASEEHPPPIEFEPPRLSNIHKARVTYKIHVPRRHRHRKSSRRMSRSDESSTDEPVVVDLYPTRDQGFVRQDSNNQNPWLVKGKSLRRNSYSDPQTSRSPRTPKDAYYEDKPIKLYRRSNLARRQSPHTTSRRHPDSALLDASDQFYQSHGSFSDTVPVWRSNGSVTASKIQRPVWQPSSKTISRTTTKYFSSTFNPDYDSSTRRRVIDEIESDSMSQQKSSDRVKIRSDDPKIRKRIQNVESKVKSTWKPTVTGLTQPKLSEFDDSTGKPVIDETESEPMSQRKPSDRAKIRSDDPKLRKRIQNAESKVKPTWKPTADDLTGSTVRETKPKSKVKSEPTGPSIAINTGRSSLNDVPTKSVDESTPRNQNDTHESNDSAADLFENESHTSEPPKKPEALPPPPPVEKKPSVELPKTAVPEPDQGTKSTIKNGVLIRGKDIPNRNQTPSSTSEVNENNQTPSDTQPKPNDKDNESVADNDHDDADRDENDEEVARSFDINKWLNDASKAILAPSKKGAIGIPSTPSQPPPPPPAKPKSKSPPRRREQPPSPPADEDLYKPPFGPKKTNPKPSSSSPPPPATTTGGTDEVDDFFA